MLLNFYAIKLRQVGKLCPFSTLDLPNQAARQGDRSTI